MIDEDLLVTGAGCAFGVLILCILILISVLITSYEDKQSCSYFKNFSSRTIPARCVNYFINKK